MEHPTAGAANSKHNRNHDNLLRDPAAPRGPSEPVDSQPAGWRFLLAMLGVGLVGAVIVFYGLGEYRTLTKHEGFVAVVSKEMLARGDYVVPRFGGLPRLKKPPLAYWAAAGSALLFGEHSEWTARFPSAAAALALAGLVGYWAARWYGREAGLAAGLIQISCVYVISFSRKAEVDMLLCLLTTGALFLVSEYRPQEPRWRAFLRWSAVLGLVGLSWLAKFHYGPAMIIAVVVVWLGVQRWFRAYLHLLNPLGLMLVGAAVFIWPYLLLQRVPEAWAIWQTETVGRALGELGRDPFWFYLPQIFAQTLPWAPLLFLAVPESWRRAWQDGETRERFLWVWFGTQFLILSASAFKHHHYLMAALPALSLIMGRTLVRLRAEFVRGGRRVERRNLIGLRLSFGGLAVAAPLIIADKWPHLLTPTLVAAAFVGIGGIAATLLLARRRMAAALVLASVSFVGSYVAVMGWIFPGRDRRLPNVRFAQAVRSERPGERLRVFALKEHPIVYYLHEPVDRIEELDRLGDELARGKRMLVVTEEPAVERLSKLATCRRLRSVDRYPDCPEPKGEPLTLLELVKPREVAGDAAAPELR